MERIQKLLSAAGICSRRQAEQYLSAGRVRVNGQIAVLGDRADPAHDIIELDGQKIRAAPEKCYLMLHKPCGYVTTLSDEKNRPTVAQLVKDCGERVYPVGRLDLNSEGLLLLTNDGDFTQHLSHPSHAMEKEYHVTVSGALTGCVERLAALTTLEDGTPIIPARVAVVRKSVNLWIISVVIHQGLNRQVRRMCAQTGLTVLRLKRVREGTLCLGDLPCGKWRALTPAERDALWGNP